MRNKKLIEDKKCAPSKNFEDGSCFTHEALIKIAINYNKKNQNKININLNKQDLVKELSDRLSNKCTEQTCWLRLDFVKTLDEEIVDNTFRPEGPSKKYEWLSTTHINDVISQYQNIYNNFIFLGAVPLDFDNLPMLGIKNLNFDNLIKDGKTKIGLVINLDEHWKSGSHWVGLFIDLEKYCIYYFDSVGKPPCKLIKKFITRIAKYMYYKKYSKELPINNIIKIFKTLKNISKEKLDNFIDSKKYLKNFVNNFDIQYNHIQHQFNNSECGVYSINFIINLARGETFNSVINDIKKDDIMNENRKIFFRNVN